MRQELMDILCCPVCKGDVKLTVKKKDGEEITDGIIRCDKCGVDYPIEDGIPNMLPQT